MIAVVVLWLLRLWQLAFVRDSRDVFHAEQFLSFVEVGRRRDKIFHDHSDC